MLWLRGFFRNICRWHVKLLELIWELIRYFGTHLWGLFYNAVVRLIWLGCLFCGFWRVFVRPNRRELVLYRLLWQRILYLLLFIFNSLLRALALLRLLNFLCLTFVRQWR